ncbi:MAG: CcmD family protein [Bacteroidetes bacterium]|nr:MAG: CcmD family protein [Bacteroidota bacterium]
MKAIQFLLTLTILCCCLTTTTAQSAPVDFMRSIGKMYVVVAVIVTIFVGIVIFLVFLDRRLTKIENQIKRNE